MRIAVNARVLRAKVTGLQRYLSALQSRFPAAIHMTAPNRVTGVCGGHVWEQLVLPHELQQEDLLFSPANTGPLLVKRQVVTVHDVVTLDRPEWFSSAKSALYKFITPRLVKNVDRVITISNYSKERLLAHVPIEARRVVVVPNGVDEQFVPQGKNAIAAMRNQLALPEGRYVLCVGSLEPRKNIPRLLQAWSRIAGQLPNDVWLVLAGKHQRALLTRSAGLESLPPRVLLVGHVADELLPALYAGATAFAFPSLYEGFGLPPLEAMACGVPVLTGNLTSFPEVVGEAGVMVDPTSVEAIADGLLRLIQDDSLRQALIAKGLARAALFSWDEAAQKTWSVLQEALDS